MTTPDDAADHDVDISDRRVREIFENRREAHHVLTQAEKAITTAETRTHRNGRQAEQAEEAARRAITEAHGALKSYIIACEDIIRDGSDEAWQFWAEFPFGRIRLTPDHNTDDVPLIRIQGLHGIINMDPVLTHEYTEAQTGFMTHQPAAKRTEKKRIPISVLWKGYRYTTTLLSERGFEIDEIQNEEWEI